MKNKLAGFFFLITSSIAAQTDSINSSYTTKDGIQHSCRILLDKAKKQKYINQYVFIETVDSIGKYERFYSDNINGYLLNGVYYKSFNVDFQDKKISFFVKEITSGNVTLYVYNGEKLDGEPIFIFKKRNESAYTFIQQNIEKVVAASYAMTKTPANDGSGVSVGITKFYDEQPYLDFFRNYLSDCSVVYTKFKSDWYTFESIETMFKDYNKCK